MLKRMKTDFPPTTDWNLSNMNDLVSYLPRLSQLPLTRELNSLIFEIREVSNLIATFQQSLSSNEDIVSKKDQASSSLQPIPPTTPSISTTAVNLRQKPFIRVPPLTTEASRKIEPLPLDYVRRSIRATKASKKVEGDEEVAFPNKVCSLFISSLLFLLNHF